jgi:KDO2-lipid IV(A) lauroyltransferase
MSEEWIAPKPRPVRWRLEYLAYRGLEGAIGVLPAGFAARLGEVLGGASYHFLRKRRQTVLRNLRIVFAGEKSRGEIELLAREVFRRTGSNLVASLHTATVDREGLERSVEVVGLDTFEAAVREGRGVVVVLAHMGNWELLAQQFPLIIPAGYKGATVYRPLNNPLLNKRVEDTRAQAGTGLFSKKDSPLAMTAFLREGGVLGMLSDQRAGNAGEIIPFMGRLTSCTPLPSIFARRTHARVMGVSLTTLSAGRWRLRFHELKGEPTTAGCMALLEELIRTSPSDVFWLQDRWRPGRQDPRVLAGKLPKDPATLRGSKPRRVLVWLHAADTGELKLSPGVPADIVYEYALPDGAARPTWIPAEARVHGWRTGRYDEALKRADDAEVLPLDAVLLTKDDAALVKACRRAAIASFKIDEAGA